MRPTPSAPAPQPTVAGPTSRSPRRWLVPAACVLVVVAVGMVAWQLLGGAPSPAEHKDATFLDAEHPGVRGFENGDCFEDPLIARARGEELLATVECVGAQNEVITFVSLDDLPGWDQAAVEREADARCAAEIHETFPAAHGAGYRVYGVPPSPGTWAGGDRDVMCVVYRPGESFETEPLIGMSGGAQG
ncbi:hypothetical protein DNL40_13040 [Xylanimonas oleitrophica]|uniref:Septum formation-related domain-containing protein n=1 Tax=Xylanimonas oleitrophica TaxID=2607479 RepID=A0A2W5WV44_9MICO|nr:hypothetical protein [Xylanimonas oleitrophica]PZR52136.1 hypothetical protein DNL40_13040 [Xylanimonas oleitrophica]